MAAQLRVHPDQQLHLVGHGLQLGHIGLPLARGLAQDLLFRRTSTPATSTWRRYFGTTRHGTGKTRPRFDSHAAPSACSHHDRETADTRPVCLTYPLLVCHARHAPAATLPQGCGDGSRIQAKSLQAQTRRARAYFAVPRRVASLRSPAIDQIHSGPVAPNHQEDRERERRARMATALHSLAHGGRPGALQGEIVALLDEMVPPARSGIQTRKGAVGGNYRRLEPTACPPESADVRPVAGGPPGSDVPTPARRGAIRSHAPTAVVR